MRLHIQLALIAGWMCCCFQAQAQQVKGKITDVHTGAALTGIRISYKNISAAITDSTGAFSLQVPGYQVSILVAGDGYQSKEIALKGRHYVTASLYESGYRSFYDDVALPGRSVLQSELDVPAAGIQSNGAWEQAPVSPDAWLQGKVAGLQAIRRSGTPGMGANLFLRGFSSLYANNQPLIVIDGVIYDTGNYGTQLVSGFYNNPMAFIDIRDIDNVTVLKDGASLYGSKGANGVILITTARARQEATRIDAALYGGVNFAPTALPVMNTDDYRIYLSEMLQSKGLSGNEIQALPYMNDDVNNPAYYRNHYRNDWQKKVFSNSSVKNGYLKITGGDNIARYGLSIGFLKSGGVVDNTDLTRYNMRFNGDFNLSKRLSAATNISFSFNEQRFKELGISPSTNPIYTALVKAPFFPANEVTDKGVESPALADADTFNVSNPLAIIRNAAANDKSYRFLGAVNFGYKLTDALSIYTTLAITMDKARGSFFVPSLGIVPDTLDNAVAHNRSGAQVTRLFSFYNDTRLSYNRIFNHVHQLNGAIGFRYNNSQSEQDYGLGYNSAIDKLTGVGYGLNSLRQIGGSLGGWKWFNTYLDLDYNYSGRYFLSFNLAMDGSSRFGTGAAGGAVARLGNRNYPLFPSLSAAWLISSERFMAGADWLQLLKIRASVGQSGNDDIGNFTARKYYTTQNLLGISGLVRGSAGNPDLQWEAVTKLNAGLDIALLNERLNITADIWRHTTDKMIVYEPAPAASGMEYTVRNSSGMRTSGWEATVNARIIDRRQLKWDVGFNIAHYRSVITKLPVDAIITDMADGSIITRKGGAPNLFYGYKTNGIYATGAAAAAGGLYNRNADGSATAFRGGDVRFVNTSGADKVIDENDRQVIGDPNPDLVGGVSTRLAWKNWVLDALFTFSQGNDIYNYPRRQLESMSGYANQTAAVNNRWRTDGQVTDMPRAAWGDPLGNSRFSDRWIEDGSYCRLRTLAITYNIPLKPGFVKYAAIHLTGNNVFTLTRYKGYDPEFSATSGIFGQGIDMMLEPQFRSVQLGVRVGL